MSEVFEGVVKLWSARGWGYLIRRSDLQNYFVHVSQVENRADLQFGDIVTFSLAPSTNRPDQLCAVNVKIVERAKAVRQ